MRVPLGGRRVRGYVVGHAEEAKGPLKPIAGVSGDLPVFDEPLLGVLRWVSDHYVAPLSVVLEKSAPPNNPILSGPPDEQPASSRAVKASAPPLALVQRWGVGNWVAGVRNTLKSGRSSMVVVATVTEANQVSSRLETETESEVLLLTGDTPDADATRIWMLAATKPGVVLVGTPRVVLWPVARLGSIVVIEEARRAMKERQTPTIHVREVVLQRAKAHGARAVFVGPTPSVELAGADAELQVREGRVWPPVEIIDRSEEAPGGPLITERAQISIRRVLAREGRVLVFTHRRGYAAATRCVACGTLRRCPSCGSRPGPGESCERCGAALGGCVQCGGRRFEALGAGVGRVNQELSRVLGDDADDDGKVQIVTERDLPTVEAVDLAIAVDLDGLLYAPHFRAAEEALRVMVRVAGRLRQSGSRLMIQTTSPEHPVSLALTKGDPVDFLRHEMETRREAGYPPVGDLVVLEIRGDEIDPSSVDEELRALSGEMMIMGPAVRDEGARWLVQGDNLQPLLKDLRNLIQQWRDRGMVVRVDVDPIDL
ncbi:MAG: hypothetical protein GEU79_02335 [Acidimicrobiia bacterium]|nr:hypothetical protein [Acidimicrobiia bacterium]